MRLLLRGQSGPQAPEQKKTDPWHLPLSDEGAYKALRKFLEGSVAKDTSQADALSSINTALQYLSSKAKAGYTDLTPEFVVKTLLQELGEAKLPKGVSASIDDVRKHLSQRLLFNNASQLEFMKAAKKVEEQVKEEAEQPTPEQEEKKKEEAAPPAQEEEKPKEKRTRSRRISKEDVLDLSELGKVASEEAKEIKKETEETKERIARARRKAAEAKTPAEIVESNSEIMRLGNLLERQYAELAELMKKISESLAALSSGGAPPRSLPEDIRRIQYNAYVDREAFNLPADDRESLKALYDPMKDLEENKDEARQYIKFLRALYRSTAGKPISNADLYVIKSAYNPERSLEENLKMALEEYDKLVQEKEKEKGAGMARAAGPALMPQVPLSKTARMAMRPNYPETPHCCKVVAGPFADYIPAAEDARRREAAETEKGVAYAVIRVVGPEGPGSYAFNVLRCKCDYDTWREVAVKNHRYGVWDIMFNEGQFG